MRELLLLVFVIFPTIHCSCPNGWELVADGQCRGLLSADTSAIIPKDATDYAISTCNQIQATTVIIHNEEEQSYWTARRSEMNNYLILGLTCNSSTKKWEWADGSPLDYKPQGEEGYWIGLDFPCYPNYAWTISDNAGYWEVVSGTLEWHFSIFCTTQLQMPVPSGDGCASFEDDSEDGVCYQVSTTANNWQDAEMICRKLGADLASIHNGQENSFVRRLAVSKGAVTGVFIGATRSGKGDGFGWIDGSEWDYDNFNPGFPKDGFGDCITMDTSTSTGQWMNIDCSEKLPVACIRKQKEVAEPTCSSEMWKEGAIITSPGFPYSAYTPCDYYLMVDEGKKVEVEIILLEANTCCDHLILYDGYLGGVVLANLTGETRNVTYTTSSSHIMQVTWQPNGGVNVLGFAMTFRGA